MATRPMQSGRWPPPGTSRFSSQWMNAGAVWLRQLHSHHGSPPELACQRKPAGPGPPGPPSRSADRLRSEGGRVAACASEAWGRHLSSSRQVLQAITGRRIPARCCICATYTIRRRHEIELGAGRIRSGDLLSRPLIVALPFSRAPAARAYRSKQAAARLLLF